MSDWPSIETILVPTGMVSSVSMCAVGCLGNPTLASAAWPSASLAIYIPFRSAIPVLVTHMLVLNGSTVNGNVDIGIYDTAGTRLVSTGAVAQSGVSTVQSIDITDTLIGPGQFYLAMSHSSGTATTLRMPITADFLRVFGCAMEASAHPLPATATFTTIDQAYLPIIGFMAQAVM